MRLHNFAFSDERFEVAWMEFTRSSWRDAFAAGPQGSITASRDCTFATATTNPKSLALVEVELFCDMSSSQNNERDAFLALLATFDLEHPVHALSDLSDGSALCDVLKAM